ncbi:25-hydroxycholesterol 7-alpha-hydroxylase [Cladorrhinum sp. PSN259]|nr:25-hydroxycholesterol 7-alpha-hydroxylase [Cladorrhinum sp. PSN259]
MSAITDSDPRMLLAGLAGFITISYYLLNHVIFPHDPREPPLAPQSIPFIGHLIGMSRRTFRYYQDLSQKIDSPIFTLPMPGQKMYIITKPELVHEALKQYKILAWPPIAIKFSAAVCGTGKETDKLLMDSVTTGSGFAAEIFTTLHAALKPGPNLDDMNRIMIGELARELDEIHQPPLAGERPWAPRVSLYEWTRKLITVATTRSVFGPLNPYDDPENAKAFWEFERNILSLVLGLPRMLAQKPIAAREKLAKAFVEYYKAGGHEKGSVLTRNRHDVATGGGISLEDVARFEVGGTMALIANTLPATFWMLCFVYSHPGLLEELREEIDACVKTTLDTDCKVCKTIDITTVKSQCPLLVSTYQEMLRHRSMTTSVRQVEQDTYLDKWLLKKGALVQIPGYVIHNDPSVWGSNCHEFDPRRFLAEEKGNRPRAVAFRAFGGGKTLCPGRHFVTNEILTVAALFAARFDMKPVGGEWKLPSIDNSPIAGAVLNPDNDIDVEITLRGGMEGVKWNVSLETSEKVFAMVTEDVENEE